MPAPIPHTYRTASGNYHLRYVFPQRIRDQFPGLGRDVRYSLRTKCRSEARQNTYQNLIWIEKSVDILEQYVYCSRLRADLPLMEFVAQSIGTDIQISKEGEKTCDPQSLSKKEFYMIMDQIKVTHPDGSITAFNYPDLKENVAALALYRAAEQRSSELFNSLTTRVKARNTSPASSAIHPIELPPSVSEKKAPPFINEACGNYSPLLWDDAAFRLVPTLFKNSPIEISVKHKLEVNGTSAGVTEIGFIHPLIQAKSDRVESEPEQETPSLDGSSDSSPKGAVQAIAEEPVESKPSVESIEENSGVIEDCPVVEEGAITPETDVVPSNAIKPSGPEFKKVVDRFFSDQVAQKVLIEDSATYRKYTGYMRNVVEGRCD